MNDFLVASAFLQSWKVATFQTAEKLSKQQRKLKVLFVLFYAMKNYRFLTIVFLIIFLAGGVFHLLKESRLRIKDIEKENEALTIVLPDAQSFSKKSGIFPYYKAYKTSAQTDSDLVGFAFMTMDIAPEILGYAGSIKMLIGMTPQGNITKVHVLSHSETPSYIFELDVFLDQFTSKGINDSFELGKDIDGISRATITSDAITRAVRKSLKGAGSQILQFEAAESPPKKKPLPLEEIFVPLLLFIIAIAGVLSHKQNIRLVALLGGLLYFGIIKSTMVSSVQIVNICLLKFPSFEQSPLWYMLIGLTFSSTLLFGMVFCGSLCPFAAVEELLYNLVHRKKKIKERQLSYMVDQQARYIKYIILFTIIAISALLGNSNPASIEPFLTLFTLKATPLGWTLLVFMLIMAFFHFRFWCKYLCPVGACLGLLAGLSPFKIKLGENCSQCEACEKVCPTRAIRMDEARLPRIDYPECILCGKCVNVCPKEKLKTKSFSHEDKKIACAMTPERFSSTLGNFNNFLKCKKFIALLIIATIMVFGIIAENARSIIDPAKAKIKTDTNEIKNKIRRAGIIPHDAMHWKEL